MGKRLARIGELYDTLCPISRHESGDVNCAGISRCVNSKYNSGESALSMNCSRMFRHKLQRAWLPGMTLLTLALLPAAFIFGVGHWSFPPLHRVSQGPVISPSGSGWESAGTFNPAVVQHDGKFVMLYRAQDAAGISRLGYAESADGIHFTRRPEPVLAPETAYENGGGVEDPRLVRLGDRTT